MRTRDVRGGKRHCTEEGRMEVLTEAAGSSWLCYLISLQYQRVMLNGNYFVPLVSHALDGIDSNAQKRQAASSSM
jgi:hypothetical protein